jgi:hypothetical protein
MGVMHGEAPKRRWSERSLDDLASLEVLASRRPHGDRLRYKAGCRCLPCRAANSQYEVELRAKRARGEGNGLIDAAPVVAHLNELSRKGVGYKAVCEAAGVGKSSVQKAMKGTRTRIRAANARAILAVTADMAVRDGARIPAKETWKLVRWLLNEGMTKTEIARRLGSTAKVPALQIRKQMVLASTAMKIERMVRMMRTGE